MEAIGEFLERAGEVNLKALQKEFEPILVEGEAIEKAFRVIRDLFIFTNKRLILVDRQGLTGKKKVEYHSFPYASITHFSVETPGRLDLDADLKIWIRGHTVPIERTLKRAVNITEVQRTLARYVLG